MKRAILVTSIVGVMLFGMSATSHAYVEWSDGAWAEAASWCNNYGSPLWTGFDYSVKTTAGVNYQIWVYDWQARQWLHYNWQHLPGPNSFARGQIDLRHGLDRGWYTMKILLGRRYPDGYVNRFDPVSESTCHVG